MIKEIKDVNKYIESNDMETLIRSAENFHSNQYNDIINMFINDHPHARFLCIAGPSSSGKTIFSNKLRHKLLDIGVDSFVVSMDNYFKDKVDLVKDSDGKLDFETIDAIEVELFNEQLHRLVEGDAVCMPKYNFYTGRKEFENARTQVDKCSLIFIEGIHALNYEVLFSEFNQDMLFGVYITPQDKYKSDCGSFIEPHQVRLVRRAVRDHLYRNTGLVGTLDMWDSVRNGEQKYIFPNKDNADYDFNSSLKYELPVLKKFFIEQYNALCDREKERCNGYLEIKILEGFGDIDYDHVPGASILNEFIPSVAL